MVKPRFMDTTSYVTSFGWYNWAISIALAVLACNIAKFTYRLVFSPLAPFPGPKLAAASGWYEFFYDFCRNGMFTYEIERMHEKYGN